MLVEVLQISGCPHVPPATARVREVIDALAPSAEVRDVLVRDPAHAQRVGFPGSPTVRVEGRDVDPVSTPAAMACRFYPNREGMPDRWAIEAAILRALKPRHILFMCVANSARSQLAEGIARSLAPPSVKVSSAGSVPTHVRPQAIRVMDEVGIDITKHRSKSVDDTDAATVDAVITLCAEEVCPVFLGAAARVHWGLPDPAAAVGDEDAILEAFRGTRNELQKRLRSLFDGWG